MTTPRALRNRAEIHLVITTTIAFATLWQLWAIEKGAAFQPQPLSILGAGFAAVYGVLVIRAALTEMQSIREGAV